MNIRAKAGKGRGANVAPPRRAPGMFVKLVLPDLRREAEARGIQTSFIDSKGETQHASEGTLRTMLDLVGKPDDADRVIVCWQGKRNQAMLNGELTLEDGTKKRVRGLPETLPQGYHTLRDRSGQETLVVCAPQRIYSERLREWGAFIPLYAAHSQESWGAGNFSDWARLSRWVGQRGGGVIGTLPILSAFLEKTKLDPSPYSPVSRLFWNEFFIDVTAIPEFEDSTAAKRFVARTGRTIEKFRASEHVDYAAEWTLRRKVLEILAIEFGNSPRRKELKAYLRERPEARAYARFRARIEKNEAAEQLYLYAQFVAHEQVHRTLAVCRENGVKFYLDLPLGVNPDGFDATHYRKFFAQGVSAGAPPDSFFTKGQDWGFAPLHPARTRALQYKYVIEYLRFQMRHTGLLRIDHVMGLHRLWWVPHGRPASEGAYVRYPADELYAILSVESHRHKTMLVGENLGTVPPEVNEAMDRHRVRRMYVLQYEGAPPRDPEEREVASLNTHDMPSFAAHWMGADIADRVDLGLIPAHAVATEKRQRASVRSALIRFLRERRFLKARTPRMNEVLEAALRFLARSKAEIVLVTLEDLWMEERSQNVPGTSSERPNWRRKSSRPLEQLEADKKVAKLLAEVNNAR